MNFFDFQRLVPEAEVANRSPVARPVVHRGVESLSFVHTGHQKLLFADLAFAVRIPQQRG